MSDDPDRGAAPEPPDPPVEPFASPSGPHAPPPALPPVPADRWAPPTPGSDSTPGPDPSSPWGQAPPYGQAAPYSQAPPYGPAPGQIAPFYGAPGPFARAHGRATTALVLGVIGTVCGILCFCTYGVALIGSLGSPVAIWLGLTARREIDATPGAFSNRGAAVAGLVTGIVGTVLLVVDLVLIALALAFAFEY